ncbi:DNA polymerase III subunit delta' [Helicobacter sp. 11S02629-2]|uniref:DNA polymerase III subunit delta' n=1 Tax=Helicobacter sp. 11S02629-2 TaxID=1476195 RepID=UPI00117A42EA|nr:DNA polymerase III subunit delta' [Helicobacter sp. 11S02629-2]
MLSFLTLTSMIKPYNFSTIILAQDLEEQKLLLSESIESEFLSIYEVEELKIDDAHNIIEEAYIAASHTKYIAIFAYSFNIFAQNALLKILEEPPANIIFLIFTNSRSALLSTVCSRMQIVDLRQKRELNTLPIDVKTINIKKIYTLIKEIESNPQSQQNSKEMLTDLLFTISAQKKLDSLELELFRNASHALNSKLAPHLAFVALLLNLCRY